MAIICLSACTQGGDKPPPAPRAEQPATTSPASDNTSSASAEDAARRGAVPSAAPIPTAHHLTRVPPPDHITDDMILIPEGEFIMGSSDEEVDWAYQMCLQEHSHPEKCDRADYAMETPLRRVTLPAFEIDRFEVSVADYRACVQAGGCSEPRYDESVACSHHFEMAAWWIHSLMPPTYLQDHPVSCVDYYQAIDFCAWRGKHLPSGDQWVKAARGTDGRRFPWGDLTPLELSNQQRNELPNIGNFADESFNRAMKSIAASLFYDTSIIYIHEYNDILTSPGSIDDYTKNLSPYGVQNMSGNVWEWTTNADKVPVIRSKVFVTHHRTASPTPLQTLQLQNQTHTHGIIRGGGFDSASDLIRVMSSGPWPEYAYGPSVGFRCARE
jgi:formylglycine-generating enzyme required for sulfatase activity